MIILGDIALHGDCDRVMSRAGRAMRLRAVAPAARAARLCFAALMIAGLPMSTGIGRPLTVDDVLRMEEVGAVAIDPGGRRIVFEKIPAYEERADFGMDEARLAGDLYVYDVGKDSAPRLLVPNRRVAGRWIGGLSPDGSRLAIYWLEGTGTKAGVYEFATGTLVTFPFTPYFDFFQPTPVWFSNDQIIYSALPPGVQPSRTAFRRDAARRLAAAWEDAWGGRKSTADVLISSSSEVDAPMRDGALVRVNARNGAVLQLAEGLFISLSLSPDGRYLAAVQRGGLQAPRTGTPIRGSQAPYRQEAVLFDLEKGGAPTNMYPGHQIVLSSFQWSPSDSTVTFFARRPDQAWTDGLHVVFDATDRKAVPVPHIGLDLASQRERGWQSIPEQAVPFGRGIAIPARALEDPRSAAAFSDRPRRATGLGRLDWYYVTPDGECRNLTGKLEQVSAVLIGAARDALFVLAKGDVWRASLDGALLNLTRNVSTDLTYFRPRDTQGAEVRDVLANVAVMETSDPAGPHPVFLDLTAGSATDLPLRDRAGRLVAVSPSAQAAIVRQDGRTGTSLTVIFRHGRTHDFWTFNGHLKDVTPARQVKVSYKLANGEEATSCASLPPDWTPGERAPLIVHVYPGPFTRCTANYLQGAVDPADPELLASLGYVVLFPFAPDAVLRTSDGPLANFSALVLPAVDALVREGYADPDRVGAYGLSYGGISVLSLLTQTGRFRAAVASHGAANFTSHYGTLGIVRRIWADDLFAIGQAQMFESRGSFLWIGSTPWEEPEKYVRASPFFDVEKITTPLLLIHSDLDVSYPMEQFDEVFTALFRMRKDAQYVRYWGEGHGLSSPANIRDMWKRLEVWYGTHLSERPH